MESTINVRSKKLWVLRNWKWNLLSRREVHKWGNLQWHFKSLFYTWDKFQTAQRLFTLVCSFWIWIISKVNLFEKSFFFQYFEDGEVNMMFVFQWGYWRSRHIELLIFILFSWWIILSWRCCIVSLKIRLIPYFYTGF